MDKVSTGGVSGDDDDGGAVVGHQQWIFSLCLFFLPRILLLPYLFAFLIKFSVMSSTHRLCVCSFVRYWRESALFFHILSFLLFSLP